MDPFVRRFIRSALVWLGTGVVIGLAMAVWPRQALAFRPAHAHGVDSCCGGGKTLAEVTGRHGLDLPALLEELGCAAEAAG